MKFTENDLNDVIAFHGHFCPGLATGMQVSAATLDFFDGDMKDCMAVVETDMCGVDAIQFFTGCTFGKGNLIHLDYGKNAFSFFKHGTERSIRLVVRPAFYKELEGEKEFSAFREKINTGDISGDEMERYNEATERVSRAILRLETDRLFERKTPAIQIPEKARILKSITCQSCGEGVMETRVRLMHGKHLCIPCYEKMERRIR